jgi:hypothetical protein
MKKIGTALLLICISFFYANFVIGGLGFSASISDSETSRVVYDVAFIFFISLVPAFVITYIVRDKIVISCMVMVLLSLHFQGAAMSNVFNPIAIIDFAEQVYLGGMDAIHSVLAIIMLPMISVFIFKSIKKDFA